MAVQFSAETHKQFEEVLTRYPTKQAAILPTLVAGPDRIRVSEPRSDGACGRVARPVAGLCARCRRLFTPCSTRSRWGNATCRSATNLSCTLRGAEKIVHCLEDRLGVKVGQTTDDKVFSPERGGMPGFVRDRSRYSGQRRLSREPDPGEYTQPDLMSWQDRPETPYA